MSNRKYLMFIDVLRDKTLIPYFEKCIDEIKKGSIRVSKTRVEKGYPSHPCFRIDGKEILTGEVLEYYLFNLQTAGFVSKSAEEFTDKMRVLCGWRWDVDRKLTEWINKILREPFFYDENNDKFNRKWVLKPETMENVLSEEYLKYACFIAICFRNYGESYDRILSEEIFSFVTALGSSLPAEIKKNGSGLVPKEIAFAKTADYSFAANDAFATIKITVKTESEATYSKIFDHICDLLEFGFPKSYAIEFKSPEKNYLPIKKLPKKGINQLFANAVLYPNIHSKIEKYARLAMNVNGTIIWMVNTVQCPARLQYLHLDCMTRNIISLYAIIYLFVTENTRAFRENLYWLILKNSDLRTRDLSYTAFSIKIYSIFLKS